MMLDKIILAGLIYGICGLVTVIIAFTRYFKWQDKLDKEFKTRLEEE